MSRLERLLALLDGNAALLYTLAQSYAAGSTPATRRAAAVQLAELQRAHPHELHSLLYKVRTRSLQH